ncbi:MAG: cupin domain-containing protein [Anaerococcus sp.]|nr:cupin domain-containing protein [Anaerococcus sp.]
MKKLQANNLAGKFEHLIEEDKIILTHLQIKKGEEIQSHKVDRDVLVIIYKGKVDFTTDKASEIIEPGDIIRLDKNEGHALKALEDADLFVVKVK